MNNTINSALSKLKGMTKKTKKLYSHSREL